MNRNPVNLDLGKLSACLNPLPLVSPLRIRYNFNRKKPGRIPAHRQLSKAIPNHTPSVNAEFNRMTVKLLFRPF